MIILYIRPAPRFGASGFNIISFAIEGPTGFLYNGADVLSRGLRTHTSRDLLKQDFIKAVRFIMAMSLNAGL